MFDLLIKGGTVVDGSGERKPCRQDIGLVKDKIIKICPGVRPGGKEDKSRRFSARRVIAAEGLYVFPGFVDIHSHADVNVLKKGLTPKIFQGVTSEVVGNCGFSFFPVTGGKKLNSWLGRNEAIWGPADVSGEIINCAGSAGSYLRFLRGAGVNIFSLVGYGTARYGVSGLNKKTDAGKITFLIEKALAEGACGLSFGLVYRPCCFIGKEEIFKLAKITAKKGKILSCHLRNEGDYVIEALEEIISISVKAKVSLQISHLKAYGKNNWHKTDKLLEMVEKANRFIPVSYDLYPYPSGSTTLSSLLEKKGGYSSIGYENIVLTSSGRKLNEVIKEYSHRLPSQLKDREAVIIKMLLGERPGEGIILFGLNAEVLDKIIKNKHHMFGSDGLYGKNPHPRTFGTFPRILDLFVKKKKLLSLEEAVYKMSYKAAQKAGIKKRGLIKEGYFADLVLAAPDKVRDRSTYQNPCRKPEGIEYVIINGKIVVSPGAPGERL